MQNNKVPGTQFQSSQKSSFKKGQHFQHIQELSNFDYFLNPVLGNFAFVGSTHK